MFRLREASSNDRDFLSDFGFLFLSSLWFGFFFGPCCCCCCSLVFLPFIDRHITGTFVQARCLRRCWYLFSFLFVFEIMMGTANGDGEFVSLFDKIGGEIRKQCALMNSTCGEKIGNGWGRIFDRFLRRRVG